MIEKRDLVVIGGGAGGLVVASVAAQLGLDVVLINKLCAEQGIAEKCFRGARDTSGRTMGHHRTTT